MSEMLDRIVEECGVDRETVRDILKILRAPSAEMHDVLRIAEGQYMGVLERMIVMGFTTMIDRLIWEDVPPETEAAARDQCDADNVPQEGACLMRDNGKVLRCWQARLPAKYHWQFQYSHWSPGREPAPPLVESRGKFPWE